MVYFTLALALFATDSYEDVLDNLTSAVPELAGGVVDKSSPTAARRRLGPAAMREVFTRVAAAPVAGDETTGAWWRGGG